MHQLAPVLILLVAGINFLDAGTKFKISKRHRFVRDPSSRFAYL